MANFLLGLTEKSAYTVIGLDQNGSTAVPQAGDVVTVVSSNTAALTITPDATPAAGSIASGFIVAVSAATGVPVVATLNRADGSSISVTQMVDVGSGPATTLTLTFATPIPQ